MLKQYTLDDGFTFETITIPKGTLLFRGIQFSDLTPDEYMREFANKGSCIPPTKNVYFYPAPYVAMAVNVFNVHILYTTNYDLELLLLVRPSSGFKPDADDIDPRYERLITICKKLSKSDGCDRPHSEDDPCFTPLLLEKFPHILGYIGLDAGDVDAFFGRYRAMIQQSMKEELAHIIPSIVANSRDIVGIPEIVLYPLHFRRNKVVRVKSDLNYPETRIRNIIWNRAKWNYTPLLYVSNRGVFTLNELIKQETLETLKGSDFLTELKGNPIYKNIESVLTKLSSRAGYTLEGAKYRMKLDLRTGFYRIVCDGVRMNTRRQALEGSVLEFVSEDGTDIQETAVSYSRSKQFPARLLRNIKDKYLMDMNEDYVNQFLHSFLSVGVFERGEFIRKYRIEEVFSRPDLPKKPLRLFTK